jgi:hypothetical protein
MRLAHASTPTLAAGCFSRKTNNSKKVFNNLCEPKQFEK